MRRTVDEFCRSIYTSLALSGDDSIKTEIGRRLASSFDSVILEKIADILEKVTQSAKETPHTQTDGFVYKGRCGPDTFSITYEPSEENEGENEEKSDVKNKHAKNKSKSQKAHDKTQKVELVLRGGNLEARKLPSGVTIELRDYDVDGLERELLCCDPHGAYYQKRVFRGWTPGRALHALDADDQHRLLCEIAMVLFYEGGIYIEDKELDSDDMGEVVSLFYDYGIYPQFVFPGGDAGGPWPESGSQGNDDPEDETPRWSHLEP